MNKRLLAFFLALLSAVSLCGVTVRRSSRGESATVARHTNVLTNSVKLSGGFSNFRNKSWVTGVGKVTRILDDDLEAPCHQRFILSDESGCTILIAHNIDEANRIAGLSIGDVIAFKGEHISNPQGGVVHWTHPSRSAHKPGGWLMKLKGAEKSGEANETRPVNIPSFSPWNGRTPDVVGGSRGRVGDNLGYWCCDYQRLKNMAAVIAAVAYFAEVWKLEAAKLNWKLG